MTARFADVPGCDWAIQVTNAVGVQIDPHTDDLHVVRGEFLSWVSSGRTAFDEGVAFTVVAASRDEAVRFHQAASETIKQQGLYLVVSLMRRSEKARRWEAIEEPVSVSDTEIEAELLDHAEHGQESEAPGERS